MKNVILSCLIALALVIVLLALVACTPKVKPEPPLQSKGTTAPPAACQDLRRRGGSC